jgi:hypothetical protein
LTCLVYLSVVNACDDAGWLVPVENVNCCVVVVVARSADASYM